MLTLIDACLRAGSFTVARALLAERTALRPTSALSWRWYARALDGLNHIQPPVSKSRAVGSWCIENTRPSGPVVTCRGPASPAAPMVASLVSKSGCPITFDAVRLLVGAFGSIG